ncbi:MAG: hypothetical protein VKO21_10715 [Candidatus Sericytochromatia bacterium]|nr:hypothetical protein [Candidatus Sericytochromatia bacterium]
MDESARVRRARTQKLTTTRGLGERAAVAARERLRELLATIRELLSALPGEVAALLGPLLQLAQGMLLGGASEAEILQMIARLERALGLLLALQQALGGAGGEGPRLLKKLLRALALAGPEANPAEAGELLRLVQSLARLVPQGTAGLDQLLPEPPAVASAVPPPTASDALAGLQDWVGRAFPGKG